MKEDDNLAPKGANEEASGSCNPGKSNPSKHDKESQKDYGDGPEYWDLRYKEDPEPFEWLRSYSDLKDFICCDKSADILHVGCGNSCLTEEMYDEGYRNIINIDNSPVVITQMIERNMDRPEMLWLEMDALAMPLPSNAFDLVIDKSLMDTFACAEEMPLTIITYLMEVARVLRTGGLFLVVSYGAPAQRLDFLKMSHLKFEVDVVKLEATSRQKANNCVFITYFPPTYNTEVSPSFYFSVENKFIIP